MTTIQLHVPSFANLMHSLFQAATGLTRVCARNFVRERSVDAQMTDEDKASTTINLDANQRHFVKTPANLLIACVSGSLLISWESNSHDLLLRAGETHFVRRNATVCVLAEQDAEVRFSRPARRHLFSFSAGRNSQPEWAGDTRAYLSGREESWRNIHFVEMLMRSGMSQWGL